MRFIAALACLLILATPAVAQDLYWMVSFDDGGEMWMSAFGLSDAISPGDYHDGEISSADGEVFLLLEASTGAFLDAPGGAGQAAGAAVAAAGESADMAGGADAMAVAEKHRSFSIAAIWAMNADTETTVHWDLEGVEAYGRDGPDGYYLVRVSYAAASPLE